VLKSLYKRIVLGLTSFFCGVSGAFLLSGAGSPGLNVMAGLIFLLSLLNLSLHVKDYGQSFKKRMAAFHPPPPPPPPKPESGGQGGGQGPGGGGGGPKN
jgi:hypothetical protein